MNKKDIMLTVSSEEAKNYTWFHNAFSTHITVGEGDNITMKMSKQIQDEEEKKN
jgi:hypothetical protein